ncbi:hypothetical protein ABIC71_004088 [Herbaspirillum seropedicae]
MKTCAREQSFASIKNALAFPLRSLGNVQKS